MAWAKLIIRLLGRPLGSTDNASHVGPRAEEPQPPSGRIFGASDEGPEAHDDRRRPVHFIPYPK